MTPERARRRDAQVRAERIDRLAEILRRIGHPPQRATNANGGASGHFETDYHAWAERLDDEIRRG